MKHKVGENCKFSDEEKEAWIMKYFKKYYMENAVYPEQKVRMKIDKSNADKKRVCSCTVGQIDEKTGALIPACDLHSNKIKPDKYITVSMQPEYATQEMKDAQLGNSLGIKQKMDSASLN